MTGRQGKCIQFGSCLVADGRQTVEVAPGEDFLCKECGKPLQEIAQSGPSRRWLVIAGVVLAAAGAASGLLLWLRGANTQAVVERPPAAAQESTPGNPAAVPPPACALKAVQNADVTRLVSYLKQGMTYASQNRYELALKEFEQVRLIDPNLIAMHENIAAAQLKLKRFDEAEDHLRQETALIDCLEKLSDSELPAFAYMLETDHAGASDPNMARAQKMHTRLRQARAVAHYNWACIRALRGLPDDAVAHLRQAVDSGFSDVRALKSDPDLASARALASFRDVLASAGTAAQAERGSDQEKTR